MMIVLEEKEKEKELKRKNNVRTEKVKNVDFLILLPVFLILLPVFIILHPKSLYIRSAVFE